MHEPLQWKLYELSGVHHVITDKGYELFMLKEKDYPLSYLVSPARRIFPTARRNLPEMKFPLLREDVATA
ncbi:hypothetical protein Tco_0376022 [Tanacetum coccineum]